MLKSFLCIILFFTSIPSFSQTTDEERQSLLAGLNMFNKKDYSGSIIQLTAFLNKYPNSQESKIAFNTKAYCEYLLKDYVAAISDFNIVTKLDSNDYTAYLYKGYSKIKIQAYQEAIDDFLRAIRINPNEPDPYFMVGSYKNIFLEQPFESIKYLNLAISHGYSPIYECYYQRGIAKKSLEDYRGAIMDFTEALKTAPNIAICYFYRGDCKWKLDDNQGAINDLTKYIDANNESKVMILAYIARGHARMNLNQKDGAC